MSGEIEERLRRIRERWALVDAGIMTAQEVVNEAREIEGLPPLDLGSNDVILKKVSHGY